MYSDDESHSESEFYYPEEMGNTEIYNEGEFFNPESDKENNGVVNENNNKHESLDDIQHFIEAQRPENTTKKTNYDLNVWNRYCETVNEVRKLNEIPANELNLLLCRFFMTITKKDGSMYEPSSLTSFQRSVQRFLNFANSHLNIFKDQEFAKSREVLVARKRQLVESFAKGNRPQSARALTEAEEDLLFEKGLFGDHEQEVLQRTVWWALSLHFGFRAQDESRKLKWGDIALDVDPDNGNEVLVWKSERGSKTRHGDGHQRAFFPTAQAANNHRCPVRLFKAFASHHPEAAKVPESPFFLAINQKRRAGSQIWYTKDALGKNSIGKFLSNAAKAAGEPGNVSNHSVRKTCISRLMDADVPSNYVAQLSGHKNLKSLDAYKAASVDHQRRMSNILSRSVPREDCATTSSRSSQSTSTEVLSRKSALATAAAGLFSGARIEKFKQCTFDFNVPSTSYAETSTAFSKKRKRCYFLDSDSDSSD